MQLLAHWSLTHCWDTQSSSFTSLLGPCLSSCPQFRFSVSYLGLPMEPSLTKKISDSQPSTLIFVSTVSILLNIKKCFKIHFSFSGFCFWRVITTSFLSTNTLKQKIATMLAVMNWTSWVILINCSPKSGCFGSPEPGILGWPTEV